MKAKDWVVVTIVVLALVLYVTGLVIIGVASLRADSAEPKVNQLWVDMVAAVATVLAMNAAVYLGLPSDRFLKIDAGRVTDLVRLIATILYIVALVAAFIIAATAKHPHSSLTDMGGTLVGLILGVLSVYLGRE